MSIGLPKTDNDRVLKALHITATAIRRHRDQPEWFASKKGANTLRLIWNNLMEVDLGAYNNSYKINEDWPHPDTPLPVNKNSRPKGG